MHAPNPVVLRSAVAANFDVFERTNVTMSMDIVCLQDLEDFAGANLPKNAYDYYRSGANDEQSLKENREAFKRLRLQPRILRDVSVRDMSTSVLGQRLAYPIAIAPTAMQRMAHHEGELATARASAAMDAGMILSSWSTTSIEDVAQANGSGVRWFQLYIYKDKDVTKDLVRRAERAGYKGIFVTVDTPILGKRIADVRNKFTLPSQYSLANYTANSDHSKGVQGSASSGLAEYVASLVDPSISWKHIEWLKSITSLPIVLKGVLTAEAAREAVAHKVAGVLVSNHGARQLDGVPATIDALPEVAEAVRGTGVEVYLDGGVRTGTDVLKALALGARAVFVGRPSLWALAYKGEDGVKRMLEILREELSLAMALAGVPSIADIDRSLVRRYPPSYSSKL